MKRSTTTLAVAFVASLGGNAFAQPSATDKATADALFRLGKELLDSGKAAEACPKLAESQRIDPRTGTLLNLAVCHEQEGKTASAWAEFNEAAAQAAASKQVEREKLARSHADELEKALSKIKIVMSSSVSQEAEVKLDGRPLRTAVLGAAIPVDPGAHTIEAGAPHYQTWSRNVTIAKGPGLQVIEVPALDRQEEATTGPLTEALVPPRRDPWPVVGLALFAAGSAALGSGVFYGLNTISKKDDAEAYCVANRCSARGLELYDDAQTSATISTVLIGVSMAMLVAGAFFVLRPKSSDPSLRAAAPSVSVLW